MGKKILKLAGIAEVILAVFFLGVALISKDDGGALFLPDVFTKSVEMLAMGVAAARLVFGLFGMLGKGRPMLIFFSFLLIFFSIPSPSASKVMLVIYVVALVVSMLYLVGALLLKKPEKAVEAGATATSKAAGAAKNVEEVSANSAEATVATMDATVAPAQETMATAMEEPAEVPCADTAAEASASEAANNTTSMDSSVN